ncbi:MAG TPA: PadR family transcriptional regulator [Gemmatimonadales bacterium]|nr:PadR family transcriptional regulator [Gemmatimonadales bacterium]
MTKQRDDWGFGDLFAGCGPGPFGFNWGAGWGAGARRSGRPRGQMFESGEVKFVILRLLREKPRHGYEIMKALEERMRGHYTPSAGTVYPTLQMLEDQGYVRAVESEGRRVYHITPEGEQFLDEHRDVIEEMFDRVRDTLRDVAGGSMGELNSAFARLAAVTYKRAWRRGPDHPSILRVVEILRRATDEIEREWERPAEAAGAAPAPGGHEGGHPEGGQPEGGERSA